MARFAERRGFRRPLFHSAKTAFWSFHTVCEGRAPRGISRCGCAGSGGQGNVSRCKSLSRYPPAQPRRGIGINLKKCFPNEAFHLALPFAGSLAERAPQFRPLLHELLHRHGGGEDSSEGVPRFDEEPPAAFFLTGDSPRGKGRLRVPTSARLTTTPTAWLASKRGRTRHRFWARRSSRAGSLSA